MAPVARAHTGAQGSAPALREHVLDLQYGRAKDEHGWLRRVR